MTNTTGESMPWVALDILLAVALAVAALFDLRTRRVPNLITVPTAGIGLALRAIFLGWEGVSEGLGGLVVGLGLLIPFWLAGGVGAGDVKLLGMVGAVCGARFAVWTLLLGALCGGVMALALLACRGGGKKVLQHVGWQVKQMTLQMPTEVQPTPNTPRTSMSYATAIALGALGAALLL